MRGPNWGISPDEARIEELETEIERLRAEGQRFVKWIDDLYSSLPSDRPPGPPRQMLKEMRDAFGVNQQQPKATREGK